MHEQPKGFVQRFVLTLKEGTQVMVKQVSHRLSPQVKRTVLGVAVAMSATLALPASAEVVELTPNELNSAYIKDSTIYIPKSRLKASEDKKTVLLKVLPSEDESVDEKVAVELDKQAEANAMAIMQANQAWDSNRADTALINSQQPNYVADPASLVPREIPGAPDGFELPEQFSYSAQDLRDLGFTHPETGQPLSQISDGGVFYGNNYTLSSDGQNVFTHIELPAGFESRVPTQGINSDILTINQALRNAVEIRLQIPQQQ
jgi:hypothetical protein